MDRKMRQDLDNYITGHYGEDQFEPEPLVEIHNKITERIVDFSEGVAVGATAAFALSYLVYYFFG